MLNTLKFKLLFILLLFNFATPSFAIDVTLKWASNNEPNLAGYRVFYRTEGQSYNYTNPYSESIDTFCTVYNLNETKTYYFVIRAFDTNGFESTNSNEACLKAKTTPVNPPPAGEGPTDPPSQPPAQDDPPDPSTGSNNTTPYQPTLVLPLDNKTNTPLNPELRTSAFSYQNSGIKHSKTQWQICSDGHFTPLSMLLDATSTEHLTAFTVPDLALSIGTKYYWRVRFYNDKGNISQWSDVYSFKTVIESTDDTNSNGIPDDQEIDGTVDLDENGVLDILQDDIKCVHTVGQDAQIGIKSSTNVTSIESIKSIDPDNIAATENRPDVMPFGIINFKIKVNHPGDTATVNVYLSGESSDSSTWYKYDVINGWQDYSKHATFSENKKSITLKLKDGGFGDADGTINGIIIDPSGIGMPSSMGGGGSGSGCFIATAAYGSLMEPHVQVLCDFRDRFLLTHTVGKKFVHFYYKYSPPAADFIAKHDSIRALVCAGLLPLVGFGWVSLKVGALPVVVLLILLFAFLSIWCLNRRIKIIS